MSCYIRISTINADIKDWIQNFDIIRQIGSFKKRKI